MLLETKTVWERIVRKVVSRQASSETLLSEEDSARFQEPDTSNFSHLEWWLAKSNFFPPNTLDNMHNDEIENEEDTIHEKGIMYNETGNEEDKSFETTLPIRSQMTRFQRLDFVVQVLVEGKPIQDMLSSLKEFLMSYGLLNEILPIPRKLITYDSRKKWAVVNVIQEFLKDVTSLEWDWWPLWPRMLPFNNGEVRVYWQCVSPGQ